MTIESSPESNGTCSPARWRELAVVIHDLSRRARPETMSRAGVEPLTPSMVEVLRAISHTPGMTVQEIAHEVGMQTTNTSAAVTCLANLGLVERRRDGQDRRRVRLLPTPEALRNKALVEDSWGAFYSDVSTHLSTEQIGALLVALPALQVLDRVLAATRS